MSVWPLTSFSYNNIPLLQNTCLGVRLSCVLYVCRSSSPKCAGSPNDSLSFQGYHYRWLLASCSPEPPDRQLSPLPPSGLSPKRALQHVYLHFHSSEQSRTVDTTAQSTSSNQQIWIFVLALLLFTYVTLDAFLIFLESQLPHLSTLRK